MLAALASQQASASDFENLPDWAKRIIARIQKPPPLDFSENYSDVPATQVEVDDLS